MTQSVFDYLVMAQFMGLPDNRHQQQDKPDGFKNQTN